MLNFRPILYVNGSLLLVLAAAMLLPAGLDYLENNNDWDTFLLSSFLTAFVGGILYFSNRGFQGLLSIRETFLFTASSWFVLPLFAGLPLMLSSAHLSLTDAYFESVSGITTTGSTVMTGLDHTSKGILLWRALLQGLGGIGVVVLAIAVLPMLRIGGMQLFKTESSDTSGKVLPRATQMAKVIAYVYLSLVFLCAFGYWLAGMSLFDAICHSLCAVATGGMGNYDSSIGHFKSLPIELISIAGMLAGGVPLLHFFQALKGKPSIFWEDSQVQWYLGVTLVAILSLTNWLIYVQQVEGWHALRVTAFSVVSIITTTGFVIEDYNQWGAGAVVPLFFLLVVGGCTGSTAGGIKMFRFQILYEICRVQLYRLVQPHGVFIPHFNGSPVSEPVVASVLSFFALFAFCFTVFSILLSFFGLDFITSMSAVAQAMGNTGPGLGELVGPASNYAAIPDGAKWLLAWAMIFGRLELFTVLVLFTVRFWKD